MRADDRFDSAAQMLSERVRSVLMHLPQTIRAQVTEIRLRTGRPLCVMTGIRTLFVGPGGQLTSAPDGEGFRIGRADMQESYLSLCNYAVHSHQREVTDGYISVRGGHRAGIAATAVCTDGKITAVREISSINLRVAREIFGAADPLVKGYLGQESQGMLLIGAPASGKTTVLRDLARQLASGAGGRYRKVCVVDESGEIGAAVEGRPGVSLGDCCDLLTGYPKAKGMQIAIRCLSPELLICDEVGTDPEIDGVIAAANAGVAVITSIHAGSMAELTRRPQGRRLLGTGAFEWVALLSGAERPGEIIEVKRMCEGC